MAFNISFYTSTLCSDGNCRRQGIGVEIANQESDEFMEGLSAKGA